MKQIKFLLKSKITGIIAILLTISSTWALYASNHESFQVISISGTVREASGETLPGVNIAVKGSNLGTNTDVNGKFQINVPNNEAVLIFSYVGFITREVVVGTQREINITLEEQVLAIDELVVIGYGVQRRSDITGSIASVRSEDLENRSSTNVVEAIQGKASGIQVVTTSGRPGEGSDIRIRGYSSNNTGSTNPLYVVDGLIVDNLQYLDPNMIESIEILKDAASAAIYGAQAGNGVVLITTKRGQRAQGNVFYNFQFANNRIGHVPDLMNAQQYIQYKTEEAGLAFSFEGIDTNWFKEVYEPTNNTSHTIGFQGANDHGNMFLSINHVDNQGIVKGPYDYYKRLTAQINAEYKIKPYLTVGTNTSIERWNRVQLSDRSDWGALVMGSIRASPLVPTHYNSYDDLPGFMQNSVNQGLNVLKDPDNDKYYGSVQSSNYGSPLIQRDRGINNNQQGINVRGTFYLNLTPIQGITYTSRFGYRLNQGFNKNYTTPYWAETNARSTEYNLTASSSNGWYYQWENFVNVSKSFDKHNFGGLLGMSYVQNEQRGVNTTISGANPLTGYEDNFLYIGYANASATRSSGETNTSAVNMSYFGRVTWSYDNRYNLQGNLRADVFDTSKLSKISENRWGYFPSFSAGWTISNEAFMSNLASQIKMDHLKLRASWGQNGNINAMGNYQHASTIAANANNYYQFEAGNNVVSQGRKPSGIVNTGLKWETLVQTGLAIDLRFLRNRLNFTYEYFKKETKDLLVGVPPHAETGYVFSTNPTINAGNILNTGSEFELGWKDKKGDFTYSINGNFSVLKNEVTALTPSLQEIVGRTIMNGDAGSVFEVGKPVWYIRGYEYLGVAKQDGAYKDNEGKDVQAYNAGDPLFKDINGDGQITTADRAQIGSGIPKFTFGLTLNAAYKNFDLSVFGTGVSGNTILLAYYDPLETPISNTLALHYNERWTPENPNGTRPFPGRYKRQYFSSSALIFKGDFFRIKQVQLGYTVPNNVLRKVFANNLRVYVSLDDFITITNYPGLDPETSSANTGQGLGTDLGNFPITKKFVLGLNLTF